jgi:GNAT superfamily N-acetyltransferase
MADSNVAPVIRRVTPEDWGEWTRLWQGYLEFYKSSLPDETFEFVFDRLTSDHPTMKGYVAELDGKLIGLVHYLFHDHFWRPKGSIYLVDLYADPAVRGTGVGRLLIEAVYKAADEADTPNVYWLTQEDNATARQLYDRIAVKTDFIKYQRPA